MNTAKIILTGIGYALIAGATAALLLIVALGGLAAGG